ncbi:MAG: bifunctional adenosylcobinamide kinase/adenosylcobinamide-phosphate guanylyltransferase [Bacillota bacterium]
MKATGSAQIIVHDLEFRYDSHPVLRDITLQVRRGDMVAIVGPNGAGKSTLLRCLTRSLRPQRGAVLIDGVNLGRLPARQIARQVGAVPQMHTPEFEFTVEELVAMGRHPHLRPFANLSNRDLAVVRQAMALAAVESLAPRPVSALSGGEQQRVAIARALAQEPEILLLDEPTAHLDIAYQVEILEILRRLNRERQVTVLAAIHDLNLAAQYFRRFILVAGGRILAAGTAEQVLQPPLLRQAYGVDVILTRHPLLGCPVVLPVRDGAGAGDGESRNTSDRPGIGTGDAPTADDSGKDRLVVLVTGGARSGKSTFAEQLAAHTGKKVVYVATCAPQDEEMRARVAEHRRRRAPTWVTLEEPLYPGAAMAPRDTADTCFIVDCLTLLVSNHLLRHAGCNGESLNKAGHAAATVHQQVHEEVYREVAALATVIRNLQADCILVTNETGMGLVPEWPLGRVFRDVAGRVNQLFASLADRVYLMVCGIPVQVK